MSMRRFTTEWSIIGRFFEQLVVDCKELVSLEKTPLVEIVMLPGPNKTDLMPHLHICGRKVPQTATIKFAKEVYGKILKGYGNRARKAHLAGGIDWKALSHAVRVNHEAMELLTTGKVTFPRPEKDLLLQIKKGELEDKAVYHMVEQGLADLTEIHKNSTLRDEPDREWAEEFIYNIYANIVKNS